MIIDYILSHLPEFFLALGFLLLAIEAITGFSVGILLFSGLGALTTGLLMNFSILPETWIAGVSCTGISSGIITGLLWKPFKKLQGDNTHAEKDNSSDLVGHEFTLESDINATQMANVNYSGINWKVQIDHASKIDTIKAGQRVVVNSVEVGLFKVKLAE